MRSGWSRVGLGPVTGVLWRLSSGTDPGRCDSRGADGVIQPLPGTSGATRSWRRWEGASQGARPCHTSIPAQETALRLLASRTGRRPGSVVVSRPGCGALPQPPQVIYLVEVTSLASPDLIHAPLSIPGDGAGPNKPYPVDCPFTSRPPESRQSVNRKQPSKQEAGGREANTFPKEPALWVPSFFTGNSTPGRPTAW